MIKKIIDRLKNFFMFAPGSSAAARILGFRKRREASRAGKILIHVGCGIADDKRYINVDSRPGWHIDLVENMEKLPECFPPDYADLIYGCHVLEHVSHLKLKDTLSGLRRILKKGGVLRLSVPDFAVLVKMYGQSGEVGDIIAPLMGGQGYPANFHASIFDEKYLCGLLIAAGFAETRKWEPRKADFHCFDDWSGGSINAAGKQWPVSLNVEALK